jgi:hypothetical protein
MKPEKTSRSRRGKRAQVAASLPTKEEVRACTTSADLTGLHMIGMSSFLTQSPESIDPKRTEVRFKIDVESTTLSEADILLCFIELDLEGIQLSYGAARRPREEAKDKQQLFRISARYCVSYAIEGLERYSRECLDFFANRSGS